MTDTQKLLALAARARLHGADVTIVWDADAKTHEGRDIVDSVLVRNAKGIGPYPMGPIAAAERLSEFLAKQG